MSITRADGTYSGKFPLKLPGGEMMAVRFRKVRARTLRIAAGHA
ncbi:MAG: hypothetical protein ABI759_09845 [Candidatus Solibacter sp.]